jgi:DNA invertase Pin-like site-specific DNA recombinase
LFSTNVWMQIEMSRKNKVIRTPTAGWGVYLRTSSDENQKPELSRSRQRYVITKNVLENSDMPVYKEYIDVLTGKTPNRKAYQQLLEDAREDAFSHVIVERADRFGRNDTEALRAIDELHEFGVAVRFANQPDLDPMDPDDRVLVTLTFTLARRESALLGLRVKGGLQAKRDSGGFHGKAPHGYMNVSSQTTGAQKKLQDRFEQHIEIDPERATIVRYAWDLLLEDRYTLKEICEELHKKGYRYKSGRPFIGVTKTGRHKANYSGLSAMFHNWTYAGWVTSEKHNIAPKTLRGSWEALVTTEEFEHGLAILDKRNKKRVQKRRHNYLLRGLVYYEHPNNGDFVRLTGSTSNTKRPGGGTAYYCVVAISIFCVEILMIRLLVSCTLSRLTRNLYQLFVLHTRTTLPKRWVTYVPMNA